MAPRSLGQGTTTLDETSSSRHISSDVRENERPWLSALSNVGRYVSRTSSQSSDGRVANPAYFEPMCEQLSA